MSVMPAEGVSRNLTFYPADGPLPARWGYDNIVYGWTPDGSRILFRSLRYGYTEWPGQLYTVDVNGGPAEPLPMPRGGAADYSPDGKRLVYSPLWRDLRTWKRYQAGWAQDLYIYDLATNQTKPVSHSRRTERDPMWIGDGIYFVSDRSGTLNLYRYDVNSEAVTQLTKSDTWDVRWASSDGKSKIVYELGGELWVYDVARGNETKLSITVPDDGLSRRASRIAVGGNIEDFEVSPKGERAVFAARGDIFSAPAEKGTVRNLTHRSGAHDRAPRWSPDGKQIAFISDMSGEEEIYLVPQDGSAAPKALTSANRARLYNPMFSPDSKRLAYSDKEGRIYVVSIADGKQQQVADERNGQVTDFAWSPCSLWLAFSLSQPSTSRGLFVWGAQDGQTRQVTDGFFNEYSPQFSADGKYIWFLSEREFHPQFSTIEWNFATSRMTGLFALALRKDVAHPFPPQSDEVKLDETGKDDGKDDAKKPEGDKTAAVKGKADASKSKSDTDKAEKPDKAKIEPTKIDFDGIAQRVAAVPVSAENYDSLGAASGFLLYARNSPSFYGRESEGKRRLMVYDLEKRKESMLAEGIGGYAISADGKKVLVGGESGYSMYDIAGGKDSGKPVSTDGLFVDRVPREEWRNIFNEVWRRYRDFFYTPTMHGYDWNALKAQYEPLLEYVSHRSDLNWAIGEMIAELNIGHAYIDGGDCLAEARRRRCSAQSWHSIRPARSTRSPKSGAVRNAEAKYRSPLTEVGVDVKEGMYLLAVNGEELRATVDPYSVLRNKADDPVVLTVATTADGKDKRTVSVNPVREESSLIYLDWVEKNRATVDKLSGGKIGYMHIPNMGGEGAYEFIKWYYPQARKNAMLIDDRANGGGNISAWVIERISRKLLGTRFERTSEDAGTYPGVVMRGPMAVLISETSASDGDIFPYMFRASGLGPLIGKRTWGGVIGITNHGQLIDGGNTNVPQFGTTSKEGKHVMEGEGVVPDIEVENDPASEIAGRDNQLERGVAELMKALAADPHDLPPRPADPIKTKAPLK
ncbi:MAG: S41 family peptidase [Acidobacteriota bacterium]